MLKLIPQEPSNKNSKAYYLIYLCLFIASISFAQGGYLLLKAHFAQYLLEAAWQQQVQSYGSKTSVTVKPWPWADIYPVAKLSFDRFDIEQVVLNNDSGQALAFGPGLYQGDIKYDHNQEENIYVISAHNDSHFSILQQLSLNDRVTISLVSGISHSFSVDNITIIDTRTEQLVIQTEDVHQGGNDPKTAKRKELVLVTCYPFSGVSNQTYFRYVVHLTQLTQLT